jgi:hypothetical protein
LLLLQPVAARTQLPFLRLLLLLLIFILLLPQL